MLNKMGKITKTVLNRSVSKKYSNKINNKNNNMSNTLINNDDNNLLSHQSMNNNINF